MKQLIFGVFVLIFTVSCYQSTDTSSENSDNTNLITTITSNQRQCRQDCGMRLIQTSPNYSSSDFQSCLQNCSDSEPTLQDSSLISCRKTALGRLGVYTANLMYGAFLDCDNAASGKGPTKGVTPAQQTCRTNCAKITTQKAPYSTDDFRSCLQQCESDPPPTNSRDYITCIQTNVIRNIYSPSFGPNALSGAVTDCEQKYPTVQ